MSALIQNERGYVNATEMFKGSGKGLHNFMASPKTRRYINLMCVKLGLDESEISMVEGAGSTRSTWIHPVLAMTAAHYVGESNAVDAAIFYHELIQSQSESLQQSRSMPALMSEDQSAELQQQLAAEQKKRLQVEQENAKLAQINNQLTNQQIGFREDAMRELNNSRKIEITVEDKLRYLKVWKNGKLEYKAQLAAGVQQSYSNPQILLCPSGATDCWSIDIDSPLSEAYSRFNAYCNRTKAKQWHRTNIEQWIAVNFPD